MADEWEQYAVMGNQASNVDEWSQYAVKSSVSNSQDDLILSRNSAIADLTENPTTWKHPVGAVLRTLQGAGELYQGVPASIALDLQKGQPQNIIPNIGKVLTGQRPAQYSDVFRGAGVPAPLAAAGGLYTDIALAPGGAEGIKALSLGGIKGIKTARDISSDIANKIFNTPQKMENLAKASYEIPKLALKEYGKPYEAILERNKDIYGSVSKLPEHIQDSLERVGVSKDSNISLKQLWDSRNDIQANLSQQFFNNQKIGVKNKYNMKQINSVSNEIKKTVLNSLPEDDRVEWLINDKLYKEVKQPLTQLMKQSYDPKTKAFNIKPLINLYSNKNNAPQQLALERLATNYVPELLPVIKEVRSYLTKEAVKGSIGRFVTASKITGIVK